MAIMGIKVEKKEKTEKSGGNLKSAFKELYHVLDAIEFAEKRDDEDLKAAYEKEAIQILLSIKKTYGAQLSKLV